MEQLKKKKVVQKLRVTILAQADFGLGDLSDLESWRDSILGEGQILKEKVEVVEAECNS